MSSKTGSKVYGKRVPRIDVTPKSRDPCVDYGPMPTAFTDTCHQAELTPRTSVPSTGLRVCVPARPRRLPVKLTGFPRGRGGTCFRSPEIHHEVLGRFFRLHKPHSTVMTRQQPVPSAVDTSVKLIRMHQFWRFFRTKLPNFNTSCCNRST